MDSALSRLAERALDQALCGGAQQAAVGLSRGRFIELRRRDGKVESLQSSTSRGLSIALYVDGRYSSNATSYLQEDQIQSFLDETLAMTRVLAPDPCRALPDPALYGPATGVELDLCDPGYDALDMSWREELVTAAEETARAAGPAVISATAELVTQQNESLQIHSNGFRGERCSTRYSVGVTVTVRDSDGRRPEDHWGASARHASDLPAAAAIGREAARRALGRVGSRRAASKRMPLLVENRAASVLVRTFLEPLGGSALQQHRSCFAGQAGQSIASPRLHLVDRPLIPRGLGSRTYDDEGLMARDLPLLVDGRLQSYLIDVYYGRKLGMPPTTGGTSNLILAPGTQSLEELTRGVQEGILVTSFLGGNSNPATGDFSFGVSGYAIERGALGDPISEMNITGSHTSLWRSLAAVGNDPFPYSSWRLPSLLFDGVEFSGS